MKAAAIRVFIIIMGLSTLSACVLIDGQPAVLVSLNEVAETKVIIRDSKGMIVHEGATPAIVTMQNSDEYLKKAKYSIIFTTPGYIERSFTISASSYGTYFGDYPNLRPLGVLVLNSKTGAMFQIDKETIQPDRTGKIATERRNDFEIYTLNQLPGEWKSHLYRLN